jgi:hypothetical protein
MPKLFAYLMGSICMLGLVALLPAMHRDSPRGLKVWLGEPCVYNDARQILVTYLPSGRVYVNDYAFDEAGARATIAHIMETREVRNLWIMGHADMGYGEFADFVGKLQRDTPDLVIGVTTESQIGPVTLEPQKVDRIGRGSQALYLAIPPCFPFSNGHS